MDPNERPQGVTSPDLRELEQQIADLKRQLLETQKLSSVGALASSITHEFNNILMTVINYAKMGLRHQDPKTRERAFEKILSAGQRASKITTGMLSYARRQADRREAVNLKALVADVLVLVEKDLQVHRINWSLEAITEPWVMVNANQIQQVILNLIINARQAMKDGGTLVINIGEDAATQMGEIRVADSGMGIAPDKLRKIFEPFFSTKDRDEQGQGGTGLGLSLCREVMESHKGRIRVESTLGKGTTFTLKLPIAKSPSGLTTSEPTAATVSKAG
jgi:signal transduction histidine kinase